MRNKIAGQVKYKKIIFTIILIFTVLIPVMITVVLLEYDKNDMSVPGPSNYERLQKAGVYLPKNITLLFFFTSDGRDGDYDEWGIFTSSTESTKVDHPVLRGPDVDASTCKLSISIMNDRISRDLKRAYKIKPIDFIYMKGYNTIDTSVGQISVTEIKTKKGFYYRITII